MDSDRRRFDPGRKDVLLSEQRQARWAPLHFLSRFNLNAGQRVVDVGCGPGFWTLPLAEIVGPSGAVWALDVSQEMLDAVASGQPPAQVHLLRSELPRINLPASSVDLAWVAFVMHEVTPLDEMVRELRRVGPRSVILDWRPDAAGEMGPPRAHRLTGTQVIDALRDGGFGKVEQTWQDEDTYLIEAVA